MLSSVMSIRDWFNRFQSHKDDSRWLAEHENALYATIKTGLQRNPEFHDAVELLMLVFDHYAFVLFHAKRWSPLLMDALLQAQDLRDSEMQVRILTQMGEANMTSGKSEAARKSFTIALERAREGQQKEMMLSAYTGIIRMLSINVPDDFTSELFDMALTLSEEVNDLALKADLHASLTMPYTYARETVKAIEHGQLAYIYWHHLENDIEVAKILYLLAAAYRFAWKLERAEQLREFAATVFEATVYNRQFPIVAYEEGAVHLQRKNYELAEQCLRLALQEAIESGSLHLLASSQHALAIAQTGLEQYAAAETNLKQASLLWENMEDYYELANAYQALGNLENKRGNSVHAREWLQSALVLCEKLPLGGQRDWLINHIQATIDEIPQ